MTLCKFATDTGRKWCNCRGLVCTEIECRNKERIAALRERTDGASYHTKYLSADQREDARFVLVRSGFCNEKHCVDFAVQFGDNSSSVGPKEDVL